MQLQALDDFVINSSGLESRFRAARLQAAWDITNESPNETNHAQRAAWAEKIIETYEGDLDKEFRRFLANPTIQASGDLSTDGDIQYVVNTLVDTFAAG
jgi:hypothetical protein